MSARRPHTGGARSVVRYRSEAVFRELLALTIVTGLAVALIPDDAESSPSPRR
jgi:hypothetical protein